jgi:hypothetical protein
MPSKIIEAHKATNGYHFLIHLDTEKLTVEVDADGHQVATDQPHPDWLHEVTFGPLQPSLLPLHENGGHHESGAFHHACVTQHGKDLTEEEYLANIEAQLPGMIELEIHRRLGTSPHHATREKLAALHGKEL